MQLFLHVVVPVRLDALAGLLAVTDLGDAEWPLLKAANELRSTRSL